MEKSEFINEIDRIRKDQFVLSLTNYRSPNDFYIDDDDSIFSEMDDYYSSQYLQFPLPYNTLRKYKLSDYAKAFINRLNYLSNNLQSLIDIITYKQNAITTINTIFSRLNFLVDKLCDELKTECTYQLFCSIKPESQILFFEELSQFFYLASNDVGFDITFSHSKHIHNLMSEFIQERDAIFRNQYHVFIDIEILQIWESSLNSGVDINDLLNSSKTSTELYQPVNSSSAIDFVSKVKKANKGRPRDLDFTYEFVNIRMEDFKTKTAYRAAILDSHMKRTGKSADESTLRKHEKKFQQKIPPYDN